MSVAADQLFGAGVTTAAKTFQYYVMDCAERMLLTTLETRPRVLPRMPRVAPSLQLTMSRCATLACFWSVCFGWLVMVCCSMSNVCCSDTGGQPRVSCIDDILSAVSYAGAGMSAWLQASILLALWNLCMCREEPRTLLTRSRGTSIKRLHF